MADALSVYLYGEQVATITRSSGSLRLTYLPSYLGQDNPVPISVQLPVVQRSGNSTVVGRFLENLLPDRPDVRQRWAREAKLTSDSAFDLLTRYGADVSGALEFYPKGTARRTDTALDLIDDEEIAARIRQIRQDDSKWVSSRRAEQAFSLGGAQGKFTLTLKDGKWYEPSGAHPSTHIFKPGVKGLDGSDATEHVVMRVAALLGLSVARTEIGFFDGERTLIVERFDRAEDQGVVYRIHQEDLAQATGTSLINKYERDGGPSYRDLFTVFDQNFTPPEAKEAKKRFAESLVFSLIVGHNDGHSKNYSITHFPDSSVLSPFYDFNSILPFQIDALVESHDHHAFDDLTLAFFANGSERFGDFDQQSLRLLEHDAGLPTQLLSDYAAYIASNLQVAVNRVIETLPAELQELPAIKKLPHATYAQTLRVTALLANAP